MDNLNDTKRICVPKAEELLGRAIKVLDKGFVRLVDYLGGDQRIVQAARVSYGKGTKSTREDRDLIHYLYRNQHTSPFEQVQLTFHCKMPVFVARQWIRHRTARLNELSGRYSIMKDEFYVPSATSLRYQSSENKQGRIERTAPDIPFLFDLDFQGQSDGRRRTTKNLRKLQNQAQGAVPFDFAATVEKQLKNEQRESYSFYMEMINAGITRELARINLPLSLYTEWYWQIDLHNLFHFLKLRLDPHAQYEIREFAKAMAYTAQAVAPVAYEAFLEYEVRGVRLGFIEVQLLRQLLNKAGLDENSDISEYSKMKTKRTSEFWKKIWRDIQMIEEPEFQPNQNSMPFTEVT